MLNTYKVENSPLVSYDMLKLSPSYKDLKETKKFKLVANFKNNEYNADGKELHGWNIKLDENESNKKQGWVYFITVNDIIYSIGMTGDSLFSRIQSYHTGHYPKGSIRNQRTMYNLKNFLDENHKIEMYALPLPGVEFRSEFTGEIVMDPGGKSKLTEKEFRKCFIEKYGCLPLGDLTSSSLNKYIQCREIKIPVTDFTLVRLADDNRIDIKKCKDMEKFGFIAKTHVKQGRSPLFKRGDSETMLNAYKDED
jgi:hypothetical protein